VGSDIHLLDNSVSTDACLAASLNQAIPTVLTMVGVK